MRSFMLFFTVALFASCATRDNDSAFQISEPDDSVADRGMVINEFSPKDNFEVAEGQNADWIELYNCSELPIFIGNDEWSISDDKQAKMKFILPDTIIEPGGYLLIWCTGEKEFEGVLTCNFKLDAEGEGIYLFHNGLIEDEIEYSVDVKKSQSYGRTTDGHNDWEVFKYPSPGLSNSSQNNTEAL